ncbi:MAG: hypothetical protein AUJ75_03265 [Candidatus Omnitrophica bacterium CG1_02_49_10]|nr:MAG: hypothetical protein AUJ75_03265 [Candidatus Omnitrophica bacterium CG1_02_49_10]
MPKAYLTILPDNKKVPLSKNASLKELIERAGIEISTPCGGRGHCGKCRVRVVKGHIEPSEADKRLINKRDLAKGHRLSCQAHATSPVAVFLPEESRMYHHDILSAAPSGIKFKRSPLAPAEAGRKRMYGLALDIGTTTVYGSLVDLKRAVELEHGSVFNGQAKYGADVISRLSYAGGGKGLEELNKAVISSVNMLIGRLIKDAGVKHNDILDIVASGNTVMQHIFLYINPLYLIEPPFHKPFKGSLSAHARSLGIKANAFARVRFLPNVSSFVGSDIVSGILSTGMGRSPSNALLVDIGTNGEVAIASKGKIVVASTAAGPAFEGAEIKCGMKASVGAIGSVAIDDGSVRIETIGGTQAKGICGSGLISSISALLRSGAIEKSGRMKKRFYLYKGKGKSVFIDQADVRQVQLAKSAIFTGIEVLMKNAGLKAEDMDHIYIAGAFGSFIDKRSAIGIGLIPAFDRRKIRFVGNSSLAGAKLALSSRHAYEEAVKIADRCEYVELSGNKEFEKGFIESMRF